MALENRELNLSGKNPEHENWVEENKNIIDLYINLCNDAAKCFNVEDATFDIFSLRNDVENSQFGKLYHFGIRMKDDEDGRGQVVIGFGYRYNKQGSGGLPEFIDPRLPGYSERINHIRTELENRGIVMSIPHDYDVTLDGGFTETSSRNLNYTITFNGITLLEAHEKYMQRTNDGGSSYKN